jgi:hypothetical protein
MAETMSRGSKDLAREYPQQVFQQIPLGRQWLGSRHGHVGVEVEERITGVLG